MNFLRIGDIYINVEHISSVSLEPPLENADEEDVYPRTKIFLSNGNRLIVSVPPKEILDKIEELCRGGKQ